MLARWPGVPSVLLSMDIYTGTLAVESLYGLAPSGSAEGPRHSQSRCFCIQFLWRDNVKQTAHSHGTDRDFGLNVTVRHVLDEANASKV